MSFKTTHYQFKASENSGNVSAILYLPSDVKILYLFAHGAGAPMQHKSMEAYSTALADLGIATLRFNFPYTEQGKKSISPKPVLYKTLRSAIDFADSLKLGLPIFAGGKSMGGRMFSNALSESPDDRVKGLIFFGFPLHAPGKDSLDRAEHLLKLQLPMLFLQGDRDKLANPDLMRELDKQLGKRSSLLMIEFADHSHHVPKKSGRTDQDVLQEMSKTIVNWIAGIK
ncbi:MAG: alpha/beta hydrolase [Calditrichaeota bacterium]|nr:alpha/beta hydrolase [Calditrichota bacterium]